LLDHPDLVFSAYIALVGLGIGARMLTGRRQWEIVLLVLSTFGMVVVYLVMFGWEPLLTLLFAPQVVVLSLLACSAVWMLARSRPMLRTPFLSLLLAFAFIINAAGYLWTRAFLTSS
jgi:hypothetical protein